MEKAHARHHRETPVLCHHISRSKILEAEFSKIRKVRFWKKRKKDRNPVRRKTKSVLRTSVQQVSGTIRKIVEKCQPVMMVQACKSQHLGSRARRIAMTLGTAWVTR